QRRLPPQPRLPRGTPHSRRGAHNPPSPRPRKGARKQGWPQPGLVSQRARPPGFGPPRQQRRPGPHQGGAPARRPAPAETRDPPPSESSGVAPAGGAGHAVTLAHPAAPAGNTGTISGLAPALIQYISNDVHSVTLTGSNFNDTFFVRSPPGLFPVTVNGGFGN